MAKGRATTMLSMLMAQTEEATRTLVMSPEMFGVVALVVFAALLAITYAFKNVGNRLGNRH